jgi:hypothetical protein
LVEFTLEKRKFPNFSLNFFFGCGQLAKIRPQKSHWSESRGSRGCPKQVWAVFFKKFKKSPVREPWFKGLPKTVLGGF